MEEEKHCHCELCEYHRKIASLLKANIEMIEDFETRLYCAEMDRDVNQAKLDGKYGLIAKGK